MSTTLQQTKTRDYFSKISTYFTKVISCFTDIKKNKIVTANLHPDEQAFFVGFSLNNEPIYRDSKAWADHQEWLKHNKSHINQNQGFLVMHRTAKEAVLLELPSQAQNTYFEKRNAQLIAAQQKDPARQRQRELCRQLFANLPAYVEDDDNLKYFDDEPKKRTKSKRKVASESSSIPEWERQQIENAMLQKEARYRSMGFNPDEETVEETNPDGANQSGAGWPADPNGNLSAISKFPFDGSTPAPGPITEYDNDTYGSVGAWGRDRTGDGGSSGGGSGKPQTTYTWDEENRLAQAETKGKTVQFAYSSSGQRVYKHSNDSELVYSDSLWGARLSSNPILEYKSIYLGDERIMTKLGTGAHNSGDNSYQKINSYYYHTNHLDSVNVISDYRGEEFEYREYTPYGEEWINEETDPAHSANMGLEPGFTGHIQDRETGLVYANARYLDPKTSRWISTDPAVQSYLGHKTDDLPAGGVFTKNNLQLYHYANNNPLKYSDPTGQWIHIAVGAVVGGAIGGIAAKVNGGSARDVVAGVVGGALGGAVGVATGGAASALGPIGAGALGGAAGGATGTIADNAISGDDLGKNVVQNTAIGAVAGGVLGGVGNAISKAIGKAAGKGPLSGTTDSGHVTDRVTIDPTDKAHNFPKQIDNMVNKVGKSQKITGGDGKERTLVTARGSASNSKGKNVDGTYEYLVEPNKEISHRMFIRDGDKSRVTQELYAPKPEN